MPAWLDKQAIELFHKDNLRLFGGLAGKADQATIESTLARPKQLLAYKPESSLFELAAAYGYGFCRNHCFPDGNKRIALASTDTFLMINGFELVADEAETAGTIIDLAAGLLSENELAEWITANSAPIDDGLI